jgi:hypothetical protein
VQELFLYSESSVGWGAIGSGDLASCNEWHSLDTSHGHTDPNGGYHYHGVIKIILYKSCSDFEGGRKLVLQTGIFFFWLETQKKWDYTIKLPFFKRLFRTKKVWAVFLLKHAY